MAARLDLREELERSPLGSRHWTVVLLLGLVTLFDGYDTFAPTYVIPHAIRGWNLPPSRASLVVSSGLIGFMIGSLLVGLIADRLGRKRTLLGAMLLAILFDMATASQARSFGVFVVLRLGAGLGLGMLLPLSVTLINEFAPRRATNLLVGCIMVGWSGGGILAALAGLVLVPRFDWPALFWVSLGAAPLMIACGLVLRESPRFLAVKGLQPQLRRVMAWLSPAQALRYADARFTTTEEIGRKGSISRLLAPGLRRSTLIVWLCAACSLFAIFGLSSWAPLSMIQRGESLGASFAFGALLQFTAVLGGVGCGWAADRLGRRLVLVASWAIAAVAIGCLAVIDSHWGNIVFIAVAGFFVMGAQPVLNNLTASLYETEIKSTGVGVELGVGRLGGIVGPYAGGWLRELSPGSPMALFLAMAMAVAVCALGVALISEEGRRDRQGRGAGLPRQTNSKLR